VTVVEEEDAEAEAEALVFVAETPPPVVEEFEVVVLETTAELFT
jgi:hypothetical protein